jgi:hypothetical protein
MIWMVMGDGDGDSARLTMIGDGDGDGARLLCTDVKVHMRTSTGNGLIAAFHLP